MGYYEKKAAALREISNLFIKEGKNIDQITLIISTKYGFSSKMVQERIELIEKVSKVNEILRKRGGKK